MRSDPYSTEYTEEELANLPQTEQVFEAPALIIDQHEWRQEGYMITDICNPSRPDCQHVGIPIPSGKMLIKDKKGRYALISETDLAARSR